MTAGLGLGGLALAAPSAFANQPFTNYAFAATGAPTPRTMPDRLAEVKNVLDFGADPTGGNISATRAAIQAAVDWTTNPKRGRIFFPLGFYQIDAPITFNGVSINDELSIEFFGQGGGTAVTGNFAGYLFDRHSASPNNTKGGRGFVGLNLQNPHDNGGCIRMGSTDGGYVKHCSVSGFNGFTSEDAPGVSSVNIALEVCAFSGTGTGTLGGSNVTIGGAGSASACDNRNNDTGWRIYGNGFFYSGDRTENTNNALLVGVDSSGTAQPTSGFALVAGSCEGNDIAYHLTGGPCTGFLISGGAQGHGAGNSGYPLGIRVSQYGLKVDADAAQAGVFCGFSTGSQFDVAAIAIANASSRANLVFMNILGSQSGGAGVPWILPTNAQTAEFLRCNVAPIWTFSQLPTGGNRQEGDEFNVSDINGAWGTTYTGGGSTHGRVRFNGTNYTVMGI